MKFYPIFAFLFIVSCSVYSSYKVKSINTESALKHPQQIYNYSNLIDATNDSWCEGVSGSGIGQDITFLFEKKVRLNAFFIKNGIGLPHEFNLRNRVKSFKVSFTNSEFITVTLLDRPGLQKVKLEKTFEGLIFNLKISSVYKGSRYDDTCISEIAFRSIEFSKKKKTSALTETFSFNKAGYKFKLFSYGKLTGQGNGILPCKFPFKKGWWNVTNEGKIFISAIIDTGVHCTRLDKSIIAHPYLGLIIDSNPVFLIDAP